MFGCSSGEMTQGGYITHWRPLSDAEKAEGLAAAILFPDGREENIQPLLDADARLKRLQEIVGDSPPEHVVLSEEQSLLLNEDGKDGLHEHNKRSTHLPRATQSILPHDHIAGTVVVLPEEMLE